MLWPATQPCRRVDEDRAWRFSGRNPRRWPAIVGQTAVLAAIDPLRGGTGSVGRLAGLAFRQDPEAPTDYFPERRATSQW